MKGIIFLLFTSLSFSASASSEICQWSSEAEEAIKQSIQEESFQEELYTECKSLLDFVKAYKKQISLKDEKYAEILNKTLNEKTESYQAIWKLERFSAEVIHPNSQATFAQLVELFITGMEQYFQKIDIYHQKQIEALDSTNMQATLDWTYMGELYRAEVVNANEEWIAKYYKMETLQLAQSK